MTTLTVRPRNKNELSTFKKVLKALDADFESDENKSYNSEFVARVLKADAEIENGKGVKIKTADLWK